MFMPFMSFRRFSLLVIAALVGSLFAVAAQAFVPSSSENTAEHEDAWRGISISDASDRIARQLDLEMSRNIPDIAHGNERVTGSIVLVQKGARELKSVPLQSPNSVHERSHQSSRPGREASTFTSRIMAAS